MFFYSGNDNCLVLFRRNKKIHAVECYDYSACLSTRKEYHLLTLVVVAPDTLPLLQRCQQIGDIIRQHGQQLVWMPGISRIDGIQEDNVTRALHSARMKNPAKYFQEESARKADIFSAKRIWHPGNTSAPVSADSV